MPTSESDVEEEETSSRMSGIYGYTDILRSEVKDPSMSKNEIMGGENVR
jgi:hypothetical protein